jgi:hypothetical protein
MNKVAMDEATTRVNKDSVVFIVVSQGDPLILP